MKTMFALAACGLLCVPAAAQVTSGFVPDDNVVFTIISFPTSNSSTAGVNDFRVTGIAGTDHLFQTTWFWRLDTDPREYSIHDSTATQPSPITTYNGNRVRIVWPDLDTRGFSAVLEIEVYSTGPTSGVATQKMTITNNTAAAVLMNLFAYADLDQCGVGGDTAVANATTNKLSVTDAGACAVGEVYAPTADRHEITSWPSVRTKLGDSIANDLNNTGLPFGPGDFTGAWQWEDRPLAPGASLTVYFILAEDFVHSGCSQTAVSATSGVAKPGTNGLAAFDTSVRPYLGRVAGLKLDNGLAGAQPVYLFGATPTSLPFLPFGVFLVDPAAAIVFYGNPFDASNSSVTPVPIPNDAVLCGIPVLFQGFWIDPGAAGSFAHSDRLRWSLGGVF